MSEALARVYELGQQFKAREKTLHSELPQHAQALVENKKLLATKHLLREAGYEDPNGVDLLVEGVRMTGEPPPCGVFPLKRKSLSRPRRQRF